MLDLDRTIALSSEGRRATQSRNYPPSLRVQLIPDSPSKTCLAEEASSPIVAAVM